MKKLCIIPVGWSEVGSEFITFCRQGDLDISTLDKYTTELFNDTFPVFVYVNKEDDDYNVNQMFAKFQKFPGILVSISPALHFENKNNYLSYTINNEEIRNSLPTDNCYNAYHSNHNAETFQVLIDTINTNRLLTSGGICHICNVFSK